MVYAYALRISYYNTVSPFESTICTIVIGTKKRPTYQLRQVSREGSNGAYRIVCNYIRLNV